jgi:MYXO-CTERM domain-containing protein
MKISTKAKLISTALVAAAIAAPIAHGETDGALLSRASQQAGHQPSSGSNPRLKTGEGFSFKAPSYWNAAPSYWRIIQRAVASTTPRVSVNRSLGVPPQYLGSGTQTKPREYQAQAVRATSSAGFDWLDAGIGAAFVAGLGALGLGAFVAVRRRHGLAQLEV